ncbi:Threonine aspartase 1 [Merluccius polli]|uniref:Threonine aspartase 1 n=1 Tax=Merluccius polli TaxID=89951 RepID=A0AA47P826_MERPO|nr:Threonine aspartase 1 [Merluccius polli]
MYVTLKPNKMFCLYLLFSAESALQPWEFSPWERARCRHGSRDVVRVYGCGEHLIRTMLARECSAAMQSEDAHQALLDAMQNKFISSPFLASEDRVLGGVIVLRCCRCEEDQPSQDIQACLVERPGLAIAGAVWMGWERARQLGCGGSFSEGHNSLWARHYPHLPPGAIGLGLLCWLAEVRLDLACSGLDPGAASKALVLGVEFLWSHSTESMCVGYMSAQDSKAKASARAGETGHKASCVCRSVGVISHVARGLMYETVRASPASTTQGRLSPQKDIPAIPVGILLGCCCPSSSLSCDKNMKGPDAQRSLGYLGQRSVLDL